MQPAEELSKAERQRLVASILARKRIGTQHELVEALAGSGCRVTQATASRDLRELGVVKADDSFGRFRYVLPGRSGRTEPREMFASLLAQHGRRAVAAQNIVVVKCEIGAAPALMRALDRLGHPLVVGTLAGDDTCLVITADPRSARRLASELTGGLG